MAKFRNLGKKSKTTSPGLRLVRAFKKTSGNAGLFGQGNLKATRSGRKIRKDTATQLRAARKIHGRGVAKLYT